LAHLGTFRLFYGTFSLFLGIHSAFLAVFDRSLSLEKIFCSNFLYLIRFSPYFLEMRFFENFGYLFAVSAHFSVFRASVQLRFFVVIFKKETSVQITRFLLLLANWSLDRMLQNPLCLKH